MSRHNPTSETLELLVKAASDKLTQTLSDDDEYYIQPKDSNSSWYLVSQDKDWVLVVKSTPQIRFNQEEAINFLNRVLDEQA